MQAATNAGAAWVAWVVAAMACLANLKFDLQLAALTKEWLDARLDIGFVSPDRVARYRDLLPRRVTTLVQLQRMYPIMRCNYEQPRSLSGMQGTRDPTRALSVAYMHHVRLAVPPGAWGVCGTMGAVDWDVVCHGWSSRHEPHVVSLALSFAVPHAMAGGGV